jgi:carboxyl-terminal processing protease
MTNIRFLRINRVVPIFTLILSLFLTSLFKILSMMHSINTRYTLSSRFRWGKITALVISVLLVAGASVLISYRYLDQARKDKALVELITQTINMGHIDPRKIDDQFSASMFDLYIKRLDYSKRFFLQEDIDKLGEYKTLLDDEIRQKSTVFFDASVEILNQRVKEAEEYYKSALAQPFDFSIDEDFETDPLKNTFARDQAELKEQWRKSVKFQVMTRLNDAIQTRDSAIARQDTSYKEKSFEKMEADARERVLKMHDDWFKRLYKIDNIDRFALYINSMTNIHDPHSEYFPPKDKENFDIAMSGQLEGIGAVLQENDGYVKVNSIVPGSPSWLQGDLKVNDLITKVKQEEGEAVDLFDMRLDEAVQLIRGKKGTRVTLTVRKVDGSIKDITITRDVVIIEETYAKSVIVKDSLTGDRVGYINLPRFYVDFNNQTTGRNCATDMMREIEKLKTEGVEGIVFDLRDNGGGSLQDAVRIAGLFINSGPIVQVRSRSGFPMVLRDVDPAIQYDGPLVVMVNTFSASASEIVAAALQDYRRAVIVGTPSTFGKGTVQTFVDLDEYVRDNTQVIKPLGSLKVTIQKFYRVNGGSTQLKGMIPDVVIPDVYNRVNLGEKEHDFPMEWTEIAPVSFTPWKANGTFPSVIEKSRERVAGNPDFALINDAADQLKVQRDQSIVSLHLEKFKEQEAARKMMNKKYEELDKRETGLLIQSLAADLKQIQADTARLARAESWHKELKKDIYLKESVHLVRDLVK